MFDRVIFKFLTTINSRKISLLLEVAEKIPTFFCRERILLLPLPS